MEIKCAICNKSFTPTRSWSKYCSEECRKKGNSLRVIKNRKKHNPLEVKTIEEMKAKEPYASNYKKIMTALTTIPKPPFDKRAKKIDLEFSRYKPATKGKTREAYLRRHEKQWDKIGWSYLLKETGLSSDMLSRYINILRKLGAIEKNSFAPSERFRLESLKLREKDIIMNTDMEHIVFHPSRGHSYIFYNPNININEIKSGVKDLDGRIREVEYHLKEAQKKWMNILFDARDTLLRELWKEFLQKNDIYMVTNFVFCLDRIFERVNSLLWEVSRVSFPKKSFAEQWGTFIDIQREAFDNYIRKMYPTLNLRQIKELYMKTERDFESNKEAFVKLCNRIINNWSTSKLEHIIVVDFLGIDEHRSKELEEIGLKVSSEIDEKTVGEIDDKLKKLSERKQPYDILDDKSTSRGYYLNNTVKQPYIETPFFKKFFQGFEKDLKDLGFKKDKLDELYEDLDETATILRIPALPDDPADLLQGESLS